MTRLAFLTRYTLLATTLLTTLFMGCGRSEALVGPRDRTESAVPASVDIGSMQSVARGLAVALGHPSIAANLRNALRRSPYNEHKLVLREYLGSNLGQSLLEAAAKAEGLTQVQFIQQVEALPEMDFYLPFHIHRVSWRGTPDLQVVFVIDESARIAQAYDSNGRIHSIDPNNGPIHTLLVAHPAEFKTRRLDIRSPNGATVQDIDESEETESEVIIESTSNRQLAPHQLCDPTQDQTCVGGGSEEKLRFIVHDFEVFENFEGAFLGSMEVEIRYFDTDNQVITVRKTGVSPQQVVTLDREVHDDFPIEIGFVMIETDLWPNPDDFIGEGQVSTSSIVCDNNFDLSECEAVVSHIFP